MGIASSTVLIDEMLLGLRAWRWGHGSHKWSFKGDWIGLNMKALYCPKKEGQLRRALLHITNDPSHSHHKVGIKKQLLKVTSCAEDI